MKIYSVFDKEFKTYGQVLKGYDLKPLLETLRRDTLAPSDRTSYTPSVPSLEATDIFLELSNRYFGGMPIQIGCCNGYNTVLNCLEYHRDSELDIADNDVILLVARQDQIENGKLDTAHVVAFLLPAGVGVELFATTLHFAPCAAHIHQNFRVAIVLPRGTNTDKPDFMAQNEEDLRMTARNKWLLAHPDSPAAQNGAPIGLLGENINLQGVIV